MPHQWIDLEEDAEADALLERSARAGRDAGRDPGGGEILRSPSNAELGKALGLGSKLLAAAAVRR